MVGFLTDAAIWMSSAGRPPSARSSACSSHRHGAALNYVLRSLLDTGGFSSLPRLNREEPDFTDAQAIAAIERLTRGKFCLLERLFPQIGRVLKVYRLDTITDNVIEAAASTLITS